MTSFEPWVYYISSIFGLYKIYYTIYTKSFFLGIKPFHELALFIVSLFLYLFAACYSLPFLFFFNSFWCNIKLAYTRIDKSFMVDNFFINLLHTRFPTAQGYPFQPDASSHFALSLPVAILSSLKYSRISLLVVALFNTFLHATDKTFKLFIQVI